MSTRPEDLSSHLREAIRALTTLRQERDELLARAHEPIAIIGTGCRLPGGGSSPEAFWAALLQGTDGVGEIPAERWPPGLPPPTVPGTRWAGLLEQIDQFDAQFFGISPREATSLDPQQRLLLEVAWEALEHAGQPTDRLAGSRTGVFVGIMNLDYRDWLDATGAGGVDVYGTTGNSLSSAAGRLAYILGLQGPCVSVDTACSSSLVAVHLACQSLRSGESAMALAAGVNLIASPLTMQRFALTQALSPEGRCRTFDARANGIARAEGCGVVILKRLSDARRDHDPILALIRGSAVNHDGQSTGFTAPSLTAQQALLRQALASAQVAPEQVGYFEAHGTGTALGDPIELEALKAVLGAPRPGGAPCVVSSVKTNLGHLESAAGIAGLLKTILVLQHQRAPRHLHFQTLNPRISLEGTSLVIPAAERVWSADQALHFAGVSSFGLSGTNANAVLQVAPRPEARPAGTARSEQLLVLTARTAPALRALAASYHAFLASPASAAQADSADIADIAYTASARRAHHAHRLTVVGNTAKEWQTALAAFIGGKSPPGLACAQVPTNRRPKLAFIFSGQGSQWLGMGRQLLAEEPAFRAAILECEQAIQQEVGWSLQKELLAAPEQSNLARSDVMQPMVFAVAVALARLYGSWGVQADAVLGHSMGEVAAAHLCGALALADAVRIICRRSLLMQRLSGLGAVAQLDAPLAQVQQLLAGATERLAVAGSNGPRSTVVSGELAAMEEFLARLPSTGVFFRRVRMDVASHSPQMELLRDDLLQALREVRSHTPQLPMYSTVTGQKVEPGALDAAYWYRNMREPVLLWPTIERLREQGYELLVEMSPHPVLIAALQDGFSASGGSAVALGTLRREQPEGRCLMEALGQLFVRGCEVSFSRLCAAGAHCVPLPSYPWQRERHWLQPAAAAPEGAARRRPAITEAAAHPILGEPIAVATQPADRFWEQRISLEALPYLRDHSLQSEVVFPGCAYLEMALSAARELRPAGGFALERMRFERLLILSDQKDTLLQTVLTPADAAHAELRIFCRDGAQWARQATAIIRWEHEAAEPRPAEESLTAIRQRCSSYLDGSQHYKQMQELGIQYGPCFQGIKELWFGSREVLAHVAVSPAVASQLGSYQLHPAWLDACLQSIISGITRSAADLLVAAGVEHLELFRPPTESAWAHLTIEPDATGATAQLLIMTPSGQPILRARGVRIQRVAPRTLHPLAVQERWLYEVQWRKHDLTPHGLPADGSPAAGLLFVDKEGRGRAVRRALQQQGGRWIQVEPGERYQQIGADQFQVNPTDPAGYHALLQAAFGEAGCSAVVHLWSLDSTLDGRLTTAELADEQSFGCRSALYLTQAILQAGWRQLPRLWLVTRGSQRVVHADTTVSVAQAPLWGLGQAIAREHPQLLCTRVDLSAAAPAAEIANLTLELQVGARDEQLALRGEERYAARLTRTSFGETLSELVLRPAGTYLISGGLSGLGLAAAATLAAQGAKHLVLIGRRAPDEQARQQIEKLQALGAQVFTAQVDVSQLGALHALIAELSRSWPPVRGVIHSAAVIDDGVLVEQTWERFERVLAPKMYGAWNLHLATLTQPLDFFVGYSSAASLLGTPGQVSYVAANAFVDALAHLRRETERCGLSINWGAISGVGIQTRAPELAQRLADRGMQSLTQFELTEVLVRLLSGAHRQVGVVKLDLRSWAASFPNLLDSPYWAELLDSRDRERGDSASGLGRLRGLLASPAEERQQLLEQFLKEQLGEVLRLKLPLIDPQLPFVQFGFDSLMAVELRNRLDAELRVIVPIGYLLKDVNLTQLTTYVFERLPDSAAGVEQEEIEEGDV